MAVETGIPAAVEDMWWSAVSMVSGTGCNLGGKHPALNVERPSRLTLAPMSSLSRHWTLSDEC
jgi:hypothetical protein